MASRFLKTVIGVKPNALTKIAIVDDDENDCLMIIQSLKKSGDFVCVGTYGSARVALAEIPKLTPDVVLMDIRMPGMSGIACAVRLKKLLPGLVVIFVTGLGDSATVQTAAQAGGDDYLLKPLVVPQCFTTIRFAVGRQRKPSAKLQRCSGRQLPALNLRQTEVMQLIVSGKYYKEIADHLGVSIFVVHKQVRLIFEKLGVHNRSEAISCCQTEAPSYETCLRAA